MLVTEVSQRIISGSVRLVGSVCIADMKKVREVRLIDRACNNFYWIYDEWSDAFERLFKEENADSNIPMEWESDLSISDLVMERFLLECESDLSDSEPEIERFERCNGYDCPDCSDCLEAITSRL